MFRKKPPPPDRPERTNQGGDPLPVSVRNEAVEGYRIWRVVTFEDGLALRSLNHQYVWQVENTAECFRAVMSSFPIAAPIPPPPRHAESPPGRDCACGFYTMLPSQPLEEWSTLVFGKVHASGSVALTGRILRCTMGYKAEHAEILSPVVLDVGCAASKACEGDVATVDLQVDYARGWCEDHAPSEGSILDASTFMREAIRQLSARYAPVEFISWI